MALDYNRIMALPPREFRRSYTAVDTITYALGLGVGADFRDLRYVYEDGLVALPTQAVVASYVGPWQRDPAYGFDWRRIMHGEQSTVFHGPLPVAADVRTVLRIDGLYDKGADKGAVLETTRDLYLEADGRHLASVRQTSFLRGDGGFGGPRDSGRALDALRDGPPDLSLVFQTRPEQALIYRLSGDLNPIHVDAVAAHAAGFDRPILHGLCTYGIAGRVLLRALCDDRPERLRRLDVRFFKPVYPGETLRFDVWKTGVARVQFTAVAIERGVEVLRQGRADFDPG